MKKSTIISLMLIVGLTLVSFTAGNNITLRLHPNKGKTYVTNSKVSQTTSVKVQNQNIKTIQTIECRQVFSVKETSSSQNVFESNFEAIKVAVTTMGMTLNYDSENPSNNSPMLANQTAEFDALINKPYELKYNELGQTIESDNIEIDQLSNVIIELPEEEITVGSQWTKVTENNVSDIDVTINMTYTVTDISKKSVDMSFTGAIESKYGTGSCDGNLSIDRQTGIVMSNTIRTDLSMTITEQGMVIPTTVSSTTTITVKEK